MPTHLHPYKDRKAMTRQTCPHPAEWVYTDEEGRERCAYLADLWPYAHHPTKNVGR